MLFALIFILISLNPSYSLNQKGYQLFRKFILYKPDIMPQYDVLIAQHSETRISLNHYFILDQKLFKRMDSSEHKANGPADFVNWLEHDSDPSHKPPTKDYFASYSHVASHLTMLNDMPRTESYFSAFMENVGQINGKIVLDIGCGTGILSFFAVWAGAKHVYCVENADIVESVCKSRREKR